MPNICVVLLLMFSLMRVSLIDAQRHVVHNDNVAEINEFLHNLKNVETEVIDKFTSWIQTNLHLFAGKYVQNKPNQKDMFALENKLSTLMLNARNYNVSTECMDSVEQFIIDLVGKKMYAMTMFDASAKLPAGVFSGNIRWTGAYDQCINITVPASQTPLTTPTTLRGRNMKLEQKNEISGAYCAATIGGFSLMPVNSTNGMPLEFTYSVCVPSTCDKYDVTGLLNSVLSLIPASAGPVAANLYIDKTACSNDPTPYTAGDITCILLLVVFLLLGVLGTLYDVYIRHRCCQQTSVDLNDAATIQEDEEKLIDQQSLQDERIQQAYDGSIQESKLQKVFLSFSFLKNADKIFNISGGNQTEIQVLHGLRTISMWWVILGHTHVFYILNYTNVLGALAVTQRWTFQAIGNATFSVDSFFFLSGLLVTFLTLKYMKAHGGKMRWGLFYIHRYLRLTPVYGVVIFFFATLIYHIPAVPHTAELLPHTCDKYWWANLLYINNFIPLDNTKQCMAWGWYLANDMQFFVISPVLLVCLYRWPRVGLAIVGALCLSSMIATGVIADYFGQFGILFLLPLPKARNLYDVEGFDYIYGKPYARISTYLVGMVTGYILYNTNCQKKYLVMKPIYAIIGWIVAVSIALAVIYGFSYDIKHHVSLSYGVLAFYTAVSRFAWSLSLAWLVIACVHGYGGFVTQILEWKLWLPLSRLTYCTYLVHPIVMFTHGSLMRTQLHYDDVSMIYIFIGNIVLSYMFALMTSLLIEAPLMGVEKIVLVK